MKFYRDPEAKDLTSLSFNRIEPVSYGHDSSGKLASIVIKFQSDDRSYLTELAGKDMVDFMRYYSTDWHPSIAQKQRNIRLKKQHEEHVKAGGVLRPDDMTPDERLLAARKAWEKHDAWRKNVD